MTTEIRVPHETVNDDVVKVVRWLARDGEIVRPGSSVVEIETSKTVLDVEPPCEGRLHIMHPANAEVPVGAVLGTVEDPAVSRAIRPQQSDAPQSVASPGSSSGASFSRKARDLIAAHGLKESDFAQLPMVREADVLAFLERQRREDVQSVPSPVAPGPPSSPPVPSGGFLADARRAASDRNRGLLWLAWNYLWRNWFLGNLVRIAPRGVITMLHRWRGVKIGRNCFIDPNAILETAYPENISLGDDVRVTAGAIIMTHIKPPHYLRDHGLVPAVLKPVVLGDSSFIGVNAVILPGVTVGKAAVVASGAVVSSDVAPFTMVSGNPAKVIKRFTLPASKRAT